MKSITLAAMVAFVWTTMNAQTTDNWVYTDALEPSWIDASWGTTREFASPERASEGTRSIKVIQRPRCGLMFLSGDARTPNSLISSQYGSVEFSVYNTTPGLALAIHLETKEGSVSSSHVMKDIPTNQWTNVAVSLSTLNPKNLPIHKIVIQNRTDLTATYFVDGLRFVGK